MLPIVSIVGRENVGKSTLFNRITKERLAVTHPEPGITRDRNIREVNLFGVSALLVDTGGYFPYESEGMRAKVKEQVEISLESSAIILFLVDAKSGLIPLDLEISERLRKLNKKILLVVNKVDNLQRKRTISEFYKLGFSGLIPISAEHGIGINTLVDKIKGELKIEIAPPKSEVVHHGVEKRIPRFAILGRPNVGKSTYINATAQEPRVIVDETPGTTIDSIDITLEYNKMPITLIDTPGLRKRTKVKTDIEYYSSVRTKLTISRCEVAILIVDATIPLTHQDKRIIDTLIEAGKGIVLAVNKIDLGIGFLEDSLRFAPFIPVTYISALNHDRIYEPIKGALNVWEARRQKISRKRLAGLVKSWSDIKINALVQTGVEPPSFKIWSHKPMTQETARFIENQIRKTFGFVGVPIRINPGLQK